MLNMIHTMVEQYPYWMAVISFLLAVITDVVWTKWSQATNPHNPKPLAAANWSACMYTFGIIYTLVVMEKALLQITVYVIGAWLGTYLTMLHSKYGHVAQRQEAQASDT